MNVNYSNFDFIDKFIYYKQIEVLISGKEHLNSAIQYINDKQYHLALPILINEFYDSENKDNLLIYFLIFYCAAKSNKTFFDYQTCAHRMQEMFDMYKSYSFLWEKAHILLKLREYEQAKLLYTLVIRNHEPAIKNLNIIINTREEFNFLMPIFKYHGYDIHRYNNFFEDRENDIGNSMTELGKIQDFITSEQEKIITDKLHQKWQEYINGNHSKPSYQGIFKSQPHEKKLNILYVGYARIREFENPTKYYFGNATLQRGHNLYEICLDDLMIDISKDKEFYENYEGKEIFEAIRKHQINIIFLDFNVHLLQDHSENFTNIFNKINNILKIPVIRYVMDCYNCGYKIPQTWYDAIDLLITLNIDNTDACFLQNKHKILHLPIMALTSNYSNSPKGYDIIIIGSDTEQTRRGAFVKDFENYFKNLRLSLSLHNGIDSMAKYIALYQNSKITFNTGCRNFFNGQYFYISTFRINEAIVNKCLLLEEGTMSCEDIYVPFVHYIPVYNRNDVMIYAQFFLKHEEWREKIVNEAYNFWQENYSYNNIWSEIERRLGFL